MHNLLLDDRPLVIQPKLIKLLGDPTEAIILQQIHYWLVKNVNIKDGYSWVYNSIKEWNKQFDWLSESTLKRKFKSLENKGLLITGNYNKAKFDRTKWYRIDYDTLNEMIIPLYQNDTTIVSKRYNAKYQDDPHYTIDYTESNNIDYILTQDSINTKDYCDDTTKENKTKNRDNTKNKIKTKNKDNKDKDKESNSNINNNRVKDKDRVNTKDDLKCSRDNNRVNTKIDNTCNIENECRIDKKESKERGSSVNTKIDNTCKIENECSIENEKKHSHGIDNTCSKESKDNFDYKRFIEWFNELANKNFRNTETNRKMIRSRLNEGYTKEDVAKVVRLKVQQWKDNQKMNKYLRFTTLFAATNFSNYLQEAEDNLEPQEKKKRENSAKEKTRKINPVEEKIQQYKLFLSEHPDNKVIKEALEQLERNKE